MGRTNGEDSVSTLGYPITVALRIEDMLPNSCDSDSMVLPAPGATIANTTVAPGVAGATWLRTQGSYWLPSGDAEVVAADSSPNASAYFLPAKSIWVRDWLPSSFVRDTVALSRSA